MPASAIVPESPPAPLTALSEEERLFQATVRRFAREQIAPHVREMDEAGVFSKDILRQFFELGLMGIEIPEEYGGQGGSFFQCVLAVEELSAVDPSAGVIVDVQNTIANNAINTSGATITNVVFNPAISTLINGGAGALVMSGTNATDKTLTIG